MDGMDGNGWKDQKIAGNDRIAGMAGKGWKGLERAVNGRKCLEIGGNS